MARLAMVTRTIKSTKVTCLCLDTVTAEPSTQVYQVAGTYPDDPRGNKKLMDTLRKNYETETFKIVSVSDKQVTELLYGMTENDFINAAQILPPRAIKVVDTTPGKVPLPANNKAKKSK